MKKQTKRKCSCKKFKCIIDRLFCHSRKIWYILLLFFSTKYVFYNFDMLVNQRYRCQFDGNSLIFIIWLILLVLPLFDSIEGYGFKIKKDRISQEKQSKDIQTLTEDMVNRTNHPSIADLKQQLENLQSNNNEQL